MKKTVLTLLVTLLVTATGIVSCKPSSKEEIQAKDNVMTAEDNVELAKDDLDEAKQRSNAAEWKGFKNDMDSVIDQNEQRIAAMQLKLKSSGKAMDSQYQKNIDALEQKNKNLKEKINTYKNDMNSDLKSFEREFNHDIEEIGNALKDVTVDNKK